MKVRGTQLPIISGGEILLLFLLATEQICTNETCPTNGHDSLKLVTIPNASPAHHFAENGLRPLM